MSLRPSAPSRQDLRWVAAFITVCLVLVLVRILTTHHSADNPASSVPTTPSPSARPTGLPAPPKGPMARLWAGRPPAAAGFADPDLVAPTHAVALALTRGSSLSSWPDVANALHLGALDRFLAACDDIDDIKPQCTVGPSAGNRKVALLLGDSTMQSYWFMLRNALEAHGWTIVSFTLSGCPAAMVTPARPSVKGTSPAACERHHAAYAAVLGHWKPSLVIIADGEDEPYSLRAGATRSTTRARAADAAYAAGLARAVRVASAPGRHVVVLSPPAAGPYATTCQAVAQPPAGCQQAPYPTWFALHRLQRSVAARTRSTYADLLPFFCHGLVCPTVAPTPAGDLLVRGDEEHLTPEYAQFLGPSFYRFLVRDHLA